MKELTTTPSRSLENDSFVETLQPHFSGRGKMDKKLIEEQLKSQMKGQPVTDGLLEKVMASTRVQIVPLLLPTKASKFKAVSMYVDDQGIAKNLPKNARASSIAMACGQPSEVRGDAFLGRLYDNEAEADGKDSWYRMDMTIQDCSSDASWVRTAKTTTSARSGGGGGDVQALRALTDRLASSQARASLDVDRSGYKGGKTDEYTWSQSDDEVEIVVPVPTECDKKNISVQFKTKSINVAVDGKQILSGNLFASVHPDDCTWTLSKGKSRVLTVSLEKVNQDTNWSSLLKEA